MPSEHQPLGAYLRSQPSEEVTLDFHAIEEILGFELPASACNNPDWWANDRSDGGHSHSKVWLQSGEGLPDRKRTDRVVVAQEYVRESILDVDRNPRPIP